MSERDERRARLAEHAYWIQRQASAGIGVSSPANDIAAELAAGQRDREALAEARELLECIRGDAAQEFAPRWYETAMAFLKRTEPADD